MQKSWKLLLYTIHFSIIISCTNMHFDEGYLSVKKVSAEIQSHIVDEKGSIIGRNIVFYQRGEGLLFASFPIPDGLQYAGWLLDMDYVAPKGVTMNIYVHQDGVVYRTETMKRRIFIAYDNVLRLMGSSLVNMDAQDQIKIKNIHNTNCNNVIIELKVLRKLFGSYLASGNVSIYFEPIVGYFFKEVCDIDMSNAATQKCAICTYKLCYTCCCMLGKPICPQCRSSPFITIPWDDCIAEQAALECKRKEEEDYLRRKKDEESAKIEKQLKAHFGANIQTGCILDVNKKELDWTSLQLCAFYNDLEGIKLLLKHSDTKVNLTRQNGWTAVYVAAWRGHADCIRALSAGRADLNQATSDGCTPVFIASQEGNTDCIRVLAELGADLNKATRYGYTPVFIAAHNGHTDCLRVLVDCGVGSESVYPLS